MHCSISCASYHKSNLRDRSCVVVPSRCHTLDIQCEVLGHECTHFAPVYNFNYN